MKNIILRNRYSLLLFVLGGYLLAIVVEGLITGREPVFFDLDNPFFELQINDQEAFERFTEGRFSGLNPEDIED